MYKNIKIYQHSRDFQKHEGILLPSSQDVYREKLKDFEGKKVSHVKIKNYIDFRHRLGKRVLIDRTLTLSFLIQRTIEAKQFSEHYREEEVTSTVHYKFIFVKEWMLHDKGVLVYDNSDVARYPDPKKYIKSLTEATLLKTDIDQKWTKATLTFDNELVLVIDVFYNTTNKTRGKYLAYFFNIVKDPEPFIQHLDFAKPETIYFANETVQLKTAKRKNRPPFVI